MTKTVQWFNPEIHLIVTTVISALTSLIAFRDVELETQTLGTFIAFYLLLVIMILLFVYRQKLSNPKTQQLLQLGYLLLGFVLMITGILGIMNSSWTMASVFLLMLFLPGLAVLRSGLNFKKMRN
ncbi:MAG: hypothetical protein K9N35_10295 [Candidatus Marinimicrobia bacterium]|nr:hypothetical protein [Candidatus Neomarinimicrobiota bacterium]